MLGVLPRTLRARTLRCVPWFYPEQWLLSVESKGHLPVPVYPPGRRTDFLREDHP